MNQARKPRGVPTGGQFAPTNRPGPRNLDLGDNHDAEVEDNGAGTDDHLVSTTGAHLSELGRDERIAALRNEIDRAMRDLSNAKGWQAFLESRSRFHRCSLGNAFLICRQSPAATQVGGFNDWKHKHGCSVKGGERAIWILAPIARTVEVVGDDGATSSVSRAVGFRAVPVFDVSQTEGPPLPEARSFAKSSWDPE